MSISRVFVEKRIVLKIVEILQISWFKIKCSIFEDYQFNFPFIWESKLNLLNNKINNS